MNIPLENKYFAIFLNIFLYNLKSTFVAHINKINFTCQYKFLVYEGFKITNKVNLAEKKLRFDPGIFGFPDACFCSRTTSGRTFLFGKQNFYVWGDF